MSIEIDILQKFNQAFETYKTLIIKDNWSLETVADLLNDFTYNSNKIEGLTLTYGETIQFLSNALVESKTSKIFNLNEDIRMLENHQKALKLIFNQYLNNHFTLDFIIQIQSIIVSSGNELDDFLEKGKGVLRRGNETIYTVLSNGAIKEFCKPEFVEDELLKLINEVNLQLSKASFNDFENHPFKIAIDFHTRFLNIHPFKDGNGRTARLLMNSILLNFKIPPLAPVSDLDGRATYLKTFESCDLEKNNIPMLVLMTNQVIDIINKQITLKSRN